MNKMDCEIHHLHETHTEKIDCLQYANCCSTLALRITNIDLKILAKTLKMTFSTYALGTYLKVEEDGAMFKEMLCSFLMPDNYCVMSENRPKAIR